jgi:hypothetical protein
MKLVCSAFGRASLYCASPEAAILFLALSFFFTPSSVRGCATVTATFKVSSENFVQSEKAVIIWDEAQKIEHFIRQADILTKYPDLGFLVPTPQIPELAEADPRIFQLADEVARPKLVPRIVSYTPIDIVMPALAGPISFMTLGGKVTAVFTTVNSFGLQIVSEQDIGGYHAVVIQADDAAALGKWLKSNGYAWTADHETWLKPYVAAKWKITAFKLIQAASSTKTPSGGNTSLVTRAIRMSFPTDRPFFPYSEPSDKQRAHAASPYGRALRIAILSNERMSGSLNDSSKWPGRLQFAGSSVPSNDRPERVWAADQWLTFAKLSVPKYHLTLPSHLTSFLDESNPRPGVSDLYFSADANNSAFRRVEVDYSKPTQHRLDFSNPISDLMALLVMVLVPGSFVYSGRRLATLGACSNDLLQTEK